MYVLFLFVYLILNLIICTYRANTYVLNALCALLSFELFFGRYHSFLSVAYRWRNIVLAIKIWIKVCIFYSCSLVMPYDGLPYYLIFRKWLGPSDLFNRINIITSVSGRLNTLCIMFKIWAYFVITLFVWLCVRVNILLTCRKHLHDRKLSRTFSHF